MTCPVAAPAVARSSALQGSSGGATCAYIVFASIRAPKAPLATQVASMGRAYVSMLAARRNFAASY